MDVSQQAARHLASTDLDVALSIIEMKDDVIRAAYHAGYTKIELHRFTGLARTTIDRILAGVREDQAAGL
jgi:hypothetical protein